MMSAQLSCVTDRQLASASDLVWSFFALHPKSLFSHRTMLFVRLLL